MKSNYLISVLSGIVILQIYISYSEVTASPVGVQKRTEETTLSSLSDDDLNDSQTEGLPAVTQSPKNARQDGDGDEESSTGGSASSSSSPAAVPLEEDSDEGEDEESPAPTQAPPPTPTKRAPLPVQLNSTFGSEWSAVIANQNEFHTLKANQNQIDKLEQVQKETEALKIIEKGNAVPKPSNETVVEKETETDTDSDKETEGTDTDSDNENEADNEIARQGEAGGADTETETETGTGAGASSPVANSENDTDNEDEEEDEATTTASLTTKVVPPSSTIKYTSVIEEWAVVTGNVSDLPAKEIKTTKNSADKINKNVVVKPALDIASATFNSEWNAITGDVPAPGSSSGTQKKTVTVDKEVSNDDGAGVGAGAAAAATEKSTEPEDDETETEAQTAKPEETKTGTDTENEEEDEETQTEKATPEVTKQTTKPKVNNTLSKETIKATTFEKEWAIVTGEEVLSDPQARASCECGKVPFAVPGGGVNEWPWTAAIVRNGFFAGGRPHCGATLINNKYALTSAHCVDGLLPDRFELWLTVHDNLQNSGSSSGTLKLPIDKILMHPNYQRHSHDNDIALIGLIDPINIGDNHYFVPACVPAGSNNYQGVMGKMAAWSTADLGKYGNRLSNNRLCRAEMPILSNDVCNRDTTHTGKITTNMLCAGYITPKPESNCVGDAGGGLVIANGGRHTLIGVTSFGYSPSRYSPTVHTRVSEYAEWILHNTRDADWCE